MIKKFIKWSVFMTNIFLIFLNLAAANTSTDESRLSIDRIFASAEFSARSLNQIIWLPDSSGYLTLEDNESLPSLKDIVSYSPEWKREIIVPAESLIPAGESRPIKIDGFSVSYPKKRFLILSDSRRVFHKTFGDYWLYDAESKEFKKLGSKFEPGSLTLAAFSPDGEKVAYVYKNNIYVENLSTSRLVQITADGSEDIFNGNFDYVYEEELFLRSGIRWSPDSRYIAYWQLDATQEPLFQMINNTAALYPQVISFKYAKPGQPNAACRLGVVSAEGGETLWFKLPGEPDENYVPQMDWTALPGLIIFQYLNRHQNKITVMTGDSKTGEVTPIFTDSDEAWVEPIPELRWLKPGKEFLWVSERDGWRHIYAVSLADKKVRLLTPGEYDVEEVVGVDEKRGFLYVIASPRNPTQRYLYKVSLDGRGRPELVSPEEQTGTHSYQFSPDCQWAFHTYSSFGVPPVTELIKVNGHQTKRVLVENASLKNKIDLLDNGQASFFRIDIGQGVLLDAWAMLPPDFDAAKKYPVLFYVYGEPWGSTVVDSWSGSRYLWHLMLTQQGYIVMSVDNRGARVPRGRAWRKSIYKQVGILASSDQARAVQEICARFNYVDAARIGVWGWSGGGAMTLNAIFRYPEIYSLGMAVAPVTDQRLYDSIYQERYMSLPQDNPEGYKNGSPLTFAHQLKGHLLIAHGTGDDNVHYQNTEVLINELVRHNKLFTLMSYPNRSHAISEGENTTRHLYSVLTDYLKKNLPAGPRPE